MNTNWCILRFCKNMVLDENRNKIFLYSSRMPHSYVLMLMLRFEENYNY